MTRVSGGGDGPLGGDSVFAENTLPRMGTGSTSLNPQNTNLNTEVAQFKKPTDEEDNAEMESFEKVEDALMGRGGESMVADEALEHIVTRVTDEGLVVELFETREARLFNDDNTPTQLLRDLARVLNSASAVVTNPIAVEGHTAAYPLVLAEDPSWQVSSARATLFQELLVDGGMEEKRIQRVTAHADREPAHENAMDTRNNRLEVVFLRNQ